MQGTPAPLQRLGWLRSPEPVERPLRRLSALPDSSLLSHTGLFFVRMGLRGMPTWPSCKCEPALPDLAMVPVACVDFGIASPAALGMDSLNGKGSPVITTRKAVVD